MTFKRIAVPVLILQVASAQAVPDSPQHPRSIFRCEIAGVPTFSDRPCDPAIPSRTTELGTLNIVKSPAVVAEAPSLGSRKPAKPADVTQSQRTLAASQSTRADICLRLQRSLAGIRSTLRSGYTAKQGEQLRVRQKELQEKRRQQKC